MRPDPRCPSCDGKVSATAEWCMHCGRDFDAPVDANAGGDRTGDSNRDGDSDGGLGAILDSGDSGANAGGGRGTVTAAREESRSVDPTANRTTGAETATGETSDRTGGTPDGPVDALVTYVAADEDRREYLAVGVPAVVWFLFQEGAAAPVAIIGAALLALYLYTRETVRETVAASAYGAGLLIAAIQVGRAAALAIQAGRPFAETLTGASGTLLFAVGLVALGVWVHDAGERDRDHGIPS